MEQINLSTHGKDIQKSYEQVVRGDPSTTWVIYGPDSSKAYKVAEQGTSFEEFLESFDESQIQFGLARVNPPGYHIQVTARDTDDLDRDELLSRVSAAAGARYSIQSARTNAPSSTSSPAPKAFKPKPAEAPKPAVSKSSPKPEPQVIKPSPASIAKKEAEDEWNEPEIEERDFSKNPLKPNTSTYKPIGRVNLQDVIKEEKSRPDPRLEIEQLKEKERLKKDKELDDYLKTKSATYGAKAPTPSSGLKKDNDKVVGGISKAFGTENGKTPAQLWAERKQKSAGATPEPVSQEEEDQKEVEQVEEEVNVSDLKKKFNNLDHDFESQKPPAFKNGIPSPGIKSAFPGSDRSEFPGLEKEEEEPKQEEGEDEEEEEAPKPSLPSRGAVPPPPPARNESPVPSLPTRQKEPEPVPEPEPEPEVEQEEEEEAGAIAIAEYDYEASEDNELTFAEGQRIINIQFVDEDWWLGETEGGDKGLFPANYVTLEQ
ncbi:unnamed protein product [Wickerhamomyces anomalus]